MKYLFVLGLISILNFSISAQDTDPIPYPPIDTEESEKKVDINKDADIGSSSTSEGADAGSKKGIVSGGKGSQFLLWSFDVKMEGSGIGISFPPLRAPGGGNGHERPDAPLPPPQTKPLSHNPPNIVTDCQSNPKECIVLLESIVANKSENLAKLTARKDDEKLIKVIDHFEKYIHQKEGFWIYVNNRWQRIDTDLALTKAVLVNLKASQREK